MHKGIRFSINCVDAGGNHQTANIKLKNGESCKITVQTGSKATVSEIGVDGYQTSYTVGNGSSKDGKTCILEKVNGNTAVNFKNAYEPTSTSVTLSGTKTFTGFPADSSIEPVFTFTLSEDGKVFDTKTVTKQGDYAFDSITYT